jgi:uncharacterized protein YjdB
LKHNRFVRLATMAAAILVVASCIQDTPSGPQRADVADLRVVSGDGQAGPVGEALAAPVVFRVLDHKGHAVPGVAVRATVVSGGGSVTPAAETDARGESRVRWTLGTAVADSQRLELRLFDTRRGISYETVVPAVAVAGAPALLAVADGDAQAGARGTTLSRPLAVRVSDRFGNPVPGALVHWAAGEGAGSFAPAASRSDETGTARTAWTLGAEGAASATASVDGVAPVRFSALSTTLAVRGLAPLGEPLRSGTPGQPLADSLAVVARGPDGAPVKGVVVTWIARDGGGSVSPLTSVTGDDGTARAAWTLGEGPGAQNATASAAGESVQFTANGVAAQQTSLNGGALVGNPAAFRRLQGSPQTDTVGKRLRDSLVVMVLDAAGNGVPGVEFRWQVLSGGGQTGQPVDTTDATGRAATTWTLGPTPGAQSARAYLAGLTPVGFNATALAGAPASVVAAPDSVVLGAIGATATFTVTVRDAYGNLLASPAPAWTALDPQVATADAAGKVTAVAAGRARIEVRAGTRADTAVVQVNVVSVQPRTVTLNYLGAKTQLSAQGGGVTWSSLDPSVAAVTGTGEVAASAPGTARVVAASASGSDTATVTVRQVPGQVRVTAGTLASGATLRATATVADSGGADIPGAGVTWSSRDTAVATVDATGLLKGRRAGTTWVIAASATLPAVRDSAQVTVVPSAPVAFRRLQGTPQADTVGRTLRDSLAVLVLDAAGNGVPGVEMRWQVLSGGGSMGQAVDTTDAAGRAATTWTLGRTPGAQSARAYLAGLTPVGFSATAVAGPPATVVASPDSVSLPSVTSTAQLTATVRDVFGNALAPAVTWTALDPAVATVDASGLVTGAGSGRGRVEARAGSVADTVAVQVHGLALQPRTATLNWIGARVQLSVSAGEAAVWSALDPGVADVDNAGGVTAVSPGTARIVVLGVGASDTAVILVRQLPGRVSVTGGTLASGATLRASATVADSGGTAIPGATVTWSSRDTTVAPVDATGLLRGRRAGSTWVIAASSSSPTVRDSAQVVVTASLPAAFRRVQGHLQSDTVGRTLRDSLVVLVVDAAGNGVPGVEFRWQVLTGGGSTAQAVDTTDASGRAATTWTLGGVPGTQTARTYLPGLTSLGFTATAAVGPPARVVAHPDSAVLTALGDTVRLSTTATDAFGNTAAPAAVAWTSLDPAIVGVDAAGLVTGLAGGTGRVEARSGTGADTVPVRVAQAVARLSIQPNAATLSYTGATVALSAAAQDARGGAVPGVTVQWSSLDPSVATVDAGGVVTAVADGQARIRAGYGAVESDTAVVTVARVASQVHVTPRADTLRAIGDTLTLTAVTADAGGVPVAGPVTWASLDPSVATVDAQGAVAAVAVGTARIEAATGAGRDTVVVAVSQSAASVLTAGGSVVAGDTVRLSATAADGRGHPIAAPVIAWSSLDPSLATVDAGGLVTGVAAGTARVVAASGSAADTVSVTVIQGVSVTLNGAPVTAPGSLDPAGTVVVSNGTVRLRLARGVDSVSLFVERNTPSGWVPMTPAWEGDWTYPATSVLTRATAVDVVSMKPGEVQVRWTYGNHAVPVWYGQPAYDYPFDRTIWLRAGESGYYVQVRATAPVPAGVGDREHEVGFGGLWGAATVRMHNVTYRTDTLSATTRQNLSWAVDAAEYDKDGDPLMRVVVPLPGGEMLTPSFGPYFRGGVYLHLLGNSLTYGAYMYAAPRASADQARAVCQRAWAQAPFALASPGAAALSTCGPEPR